MVWILPVIIPCRPKTFGQVYTASSWICRSFVDQSYQCQPVRHSSRRVWDASSGTKFLHAVCMTFVFRALYFRKYPVFLLISMPTLTLCGNKPAFLSMMTVSKFAAFLLSLAPVAYFSSICCVQLLREVQLICCGNCIYILNTSRQLGVHCYFGTSHCHCNAY